MKIGIPKLIAIASTLLLGAGTANAAFIYDVNLTIGSGGATGTITTDETIGSLQEGNILGWNLLINNGSSSFNLLTGNSSVRIDGNTFTGSTTALSFNFSGPASTFVLFQNPNIGSGTNWLCFEVSFCSNGNSLNTRVGGTTAQGAQLQGVQTVATRRVTQVPEPATLGLLGLGLVGLGFARRRKTQA